MQQILSIMVNGVIVKALPTNTGEIRRRIIIPLCIQRELIKEVHNTSHPGVKATMAIGLEI